MKRRGSKISTNPMCMPQSSMIFLPPIVSSRQLRPTSWPAPNGVILISGIVDQLTDSNKTGNDWNSISMKVLSTCDIFLFFLARHESSKQNKCLRYLLIACSAFRNQMANRISGTHNTITIYVEQFSWVLMEFQWKFLLQNNILYENLNCVYNFETSIKVVCLPAYVCAYVYVNDCWIY